MAVCIKAAPLALDIKQASTNAAAAATEQQRFLRLAPLEKLFLQATQDGVARQSL